MPRMRVALVVSLVAASCATSPVVRSPLREQLAKADNSQIEDATRDCLAQGGWKVDPIADLVAGARRVSASKAKDLTEVYINPPDVKPRITGGPDWSSDPFWSCLSAWLAGNKPASPAPSASAAEQ
jgi:hypothetical protein